ncbi:hypothetical protein [Bacillus clarus]|uniref:Uncharacterized protein n=1 Tax=Bacillus clarus TaxID=2338372 RepID=A0A090YN21_9BACI|nr:hypothetical protein [Bacillus clarus]KFM99601.1 hypothetical protein DJ93_3736 [Bacillus clarus]
MEKTEANSTALMIERNTGVNDILKAFESDRNNITIAKNSSGIVKVPSSLDSNPITIENNNESLRISLPKLNSKNAIKTENGTIIYQDPNEPADLAVQTTKDGVRSLIKIKDASAPNEYKFIVNIPNGGKLITSAEYMGEEYDTGEIFIVDSENMIQSVFSPAWAKDANGKPISTHYKLEGNNLIQVVDFNENTAFPVIADPDWVKIGKCSGALVAFVGGNLIAVSKLIKIKKYINALGGFSQTAKLLVGATTWEERMRVGGQALVGLAAELTGATGVWAACK